MFRLFTNKIVQSPIIKKSLTSTVRMRRFIRSNADTIGFLSVLLSGAGIVTWMNVKNPHDERKIIYEGIHDLDKNDTKGYIVDSSHFSYVGKKPAGHLSGGFVKNHKTNLCYLKKGASSIDSLIREFIISNFLSLARPGIQPESLIMQEELPDGRARFYTLSRVFDRTMNMEEFITQCDWKEKLKTKPLLGFEVALAADLMLSKQKDMKFENYLVIEKEDAFYVANIDHECSLSIFSGQMIFSTDLNCLIRHVRDLNLPDENNQSALAGDPRAWQFVNEVKKFMRPENVAEFYQHIQALPVEKVLESIIHIEDVGKNSLTHAMKSHKIIEKLKNMQLASLNFLYSSEEKENIKSHQYAS